MIEIQTPYLHYKNTRRRTPKHIQVDEGLLNSIEGTLSKHSILYQTQQILNKYFVYKCDGDKCKLFLSLLKSRGMNIVWPVYLVKVRQKYSYVKD